MFATNLKDAKELAIAGAKRTKKPRYISINGGSNYLVETHRPAVGRYWEALPDGTLRDVMTYSMLMWLQSHRCSEVPTFINHDGIRKRYAAIGWLDDGKPNGDEVFIYQEEPETCKQER